MSDRNRRIHCFVDAEIGGNSGMQLLYVFIMSTGSKMLMIMVLIYYTLIINHLMMNVY